MRKCPRCHQEMVDDCYLHDLAQPMTNYVLIEKDEDLKKTQYPLKAALCKTCGYMELYADLKNEDEKKK